MRSAWPPARTPERPAERELLEDAFTFQLRRFSRKPDAAVKYVAQGERPRDATAERQRAGGLHDASASLILNLDETITKVMKRVSCMDPRVAYAQLMTRRHFFGRSARGIGVAALAQLLGQEPLASPTAPDRRLPGCRTSRRRPSASSICSRGRAVADRSVRLQAAAREVQRRPNCRTRSARASG